jgi:chromosome segregation ATPase
LVETKQSSISTQSQIEQTLKERIVKLDREIEELKKDLRQKTQTIEDLSQKYDESEKEKEQIKFASDKL